MKNSDISDPIFLEAVEAIDSGNISLLENLLKQHTVLVRNRLVYPGGDYFQHPYLLWFVANNPIRAEKLPSNILDVTKLIIQFIKLTAPAILQEQLDYALELTATGRIPRECSVQIQMIDLLIDEGAKPGNGLGALAHGNKEAAEHLIERGGKLSLPVAVGLNRIADIQHLAFLADEEELLTALTVAAFYGQPGTISFLLSRRANPNGYPKNGTGFHSHATPLHQAVYSGSAESVKLLVEAGADLTATDKIYDGSPADWAAHMQSGTDFDNTAKQNFTLIEDYLKKNFNLCREINDGLLNQKKVH